MKNLLKKDKRNRKIFKDLEHKKLILKSLMRNFCFSMLTRWKGFEKLQLLSKKSVLSFLTNRCVITGRKKRITKAYSFSRIALLKLIRLSRINGVKKASW